MLQREEKKISHTLITFIAMLTLDIRVRQIYALQLPFGFLLFSEIIWIVTNDQIQALDK